MRITLTALTLGVVLATGIPAQDEGPNLSTKFGIGTTTQYFYRGIQQENGGFSVQPEIGIGGVVHESDDAVSQVHWEMGLWNSLHEGNTGTSGGAQTMWYESRFYLGVGASLPSNVDASMRYVVRSSPNGVFSTTEELQFLAEWDDSDRWEDSDIGGLHPSVELSFELSGGSDAGADLGTYLGLSATPSYVLDEFITVKAPITFGFSLGDYYENAGGADDTFGFLSLGLMGEMTEVLPPEYGPWVLTGGLELLFLGDNAETINTGDPFEAILSVGMMLHW